MLPVPLALSPMQSTVRRVDPYVEVRSDRPQRLNISPPIVADLAANTSVLIYDATGAEDGGLFYDKFQIHNVGVAPLLVGLNMTPVADAYHDVLAPDTAANNGLGSIMDISPFILDKVYLRNDTAVTARYCILKARRQTNVV